MSAELPPLNRIVKEDEFAHLVGWYHGTIARMRRAGKIEYQRDGRYGIHYLVPDHITSFHSRIQKRGSK